MSPLPTKPAFYRSAHHAIYLPHRAQRKFQRSGAFPRLTGHARPVSDASFDSHGDQLLAVAEKLRGRMKRREKGCSPRIAGGFW